MTMRIKTLLHLKSKMVCMSVGVQYPMYSTTWRLVIIQLNCWIKQGRTTDFSTCTFPLGSHMHTDHICMCSFVSVATGFFQCKLLKILPLVTLGFLFVFPCSLYWSWSKHLSCIINFLKIRYSSLLVFNLRFFHSFVSFAFSFLTHLVHDALPF